MKSPDVGTFGENKMSNEVEVMDVVASQNYQAAHSVMVMGNEQNKGLIIPAAVNVPKSRFAGLKIKILCHAGMSMYTGPLLANNLLYIGNRIKRYLPQA